MVGVASMVGTRYGIMVGVASTVGVASVVSVTSMVGVATTVGVASMVGLNCTVLRVYNAFCPFQLL